jgi:2-hydroxy-6-oxonona-2,4-dienedioate hydrolase
LTAPEERLWLPAGEHLLHTRAFGRPGAPAIVLVHGAVVSSRYFRPLARLLAADFRVLLPDLPGYGESDAPGRLLGVPELAGVLALWSRAHAGGAAVWVGNSLGCQVVAELAAESPDLVQSIVFVGPTVDRRARSAPRQLARLVRDAPREQLSLVGTWIRDLYSAGLRRAWGTLGVALRDDIEDKLPRIRAPRLVVRGARDPLAPQRWAEEVARGGELAVIPGAAHAAHHSHPREVAGHIRRFANATGALPPTR